MNLSNNRFFHNQLSFRCREEGQDETHDLKCDRFGYETKDAIYEVDFIHGLATVFRKNMGIVPMCAHHKRIVKHFMPQILVL